MDRILIIDDDEELCELLEEYLRTENVRILSVHDGEDGLKEVLSGCHDLAVLDVMLPRLTGLEVLRRIRNAGGAVGQTPVLMLTARGDDVDRIVGLELGADDYLSKPFNARELAARIGAILRRARSRNSEPPPARINIDDVDIDVPSREVRLRDCLIEVTAAEFDILALLMGSAGRVVERDQIARDVFHRRTVPFDRSIDMHISHLRRKLGPHSDGSDRIKTIRGAGYLYTRPHATER